jgi:hypothetical protein
MGVGYQMSGWDGQWMGIPLHSAGYRVVCGQQRSGGGLLLWVSLSVGGRATNDK